MTIDDTALRSTNVTIFEQDLKQAKALAHAISIAQREFDSTLDREGIPPTPTHHRVFHDSELTLRYETVRNVLLLLRVELDGLIENWQEELKTT